jgi:CotH kinase protein/Bacterial Ig-like domain (group 3)
MNKSSVKKAKTHALCAIGLLSLTACFGQTFTVSATPSSLTIYPGQQNVAVAISASRNGYSGPINITLSGLPSGIAASPLTIGASESSGTVILNASVAAGQEGFLPTGPSMNTSFAAQVTVLGSGGSYQAPALLSLTVSISNPSFAPAASAINLPIVNINTNGAAIVNTTTDVPGTITITSADTKTSYLPNASDTDNTATFHVHGHTTADMPKLPYHISLTTSLDLLYTMGLPCPYVTSGKAKPTCDKSKSFLLLANYDDKTFLRDWSASALANAIPIGNGYLNEPANSPSPSGTSALMPWASHSLFVELYVNGVYEGNYQLIEEVKVDSHRVNISELTATDTSPTQVTGGYLMEIDQHQDEAYVFFTPQNLPIGLIDPDFSPDPEVPAQTSYISNYVDTAETALFSSNFTDPTQGWRAYYDETSAINYYIVNDVMGNVDGGDFYSSVYLYKDLQNPFIYMGPVWDFDISSGNVNYASITDPTVPWTQTNAIWYEQWFKDPGFRADVAMQFNTLKKNGVFAAWLVSIQQQAKSLQQSAVNNFGRWPMQGIEVWPNAQAAGNYAGEVQYLINWLTLRIAYLDSLFNNKPTPSIALNTPAAPLLNSSTATLAAEVTGGANPTGTVSFLSSGVLLGTALLNGSGVASVTVTNVPTGPQNLQAVYNGDEYNALSYSAVKSVTVAVPAAGSVTNISAATSSAAESRSVESVTASVSGTSGIAVPTGTITFTVDLGYGITVTLDGSGQASYFTGRLSAGMHTIVASYSGDANYSASSSTPIVFQVALSPIKRPVEH